MSEHVGMYTAVKVDETPCRQAVQTLEQEGPLH